MVWNKTNKQLETAINPTSAIKDKKNNLKSTKAEVTSIDVVMAIDQDLDEKVIDEEKKKAPKIHKSKSKNKKRSSDERSGEISPADLDSVLEKKAREVLEAYMKKDIKSAAADIKQLEAKLILMNGKFKADNMKSGEQDVRILQEVKDQMGNREDIYKLIESIKESTLAELMAKKEKRQRKLLEDKEIKNQVEEIQTNMINQDTMLNADDENDIKRFSAFLCKNKNPEEKKRCLEEVREYFEKKRRARIAKHAKQEEDAKTIRINEKTDNNSMEHSSEPTKDKPEDPKEKKRKSAEDEIVEKAVADTLQQFTDLYRFRIPEGVIDDMKKNIVQSIQNENLNKCNGHKRVEGISLIFELKDNARSPSLSLTDNANGNREMLPKRDNIDKGTNSVGNNQVCVFPDEENVVSKDSSKEIKKSRGEKAEDKRRKSSSKEIDIVECENNDQLKREFERCLYAIQEQVDLTGAKLFSIIFEKEEESATKKSKLIYNFSKDSDAFRISYEKSGIGKSDVNITNSRDSATARNSSKAKNGTKNAKTQTPSEGFKVQDKDAQTLETKLVQSSTQTDSFDLNGNGDLKPGLFRIVQAPEGDRYYLYPESLHPTLNKLSKKRDASVLENSDKNESKIDPKISLLQKTKEGSISDKGIFVKDKNHKKLDRNIKSDCFGMNKQPQQFYEYSNSKKKPVEDRGVTAVNYIFLKQPSVEKETAEPYSPKEVKAPMINQWEGYNKKQEASMINQWEGEINKKQEEEKKHAECVWLWNGKKMDPGSDLKIHVEDLLNEKIKEFIENNREERRKVENKASGCCRNNCRCQSYIDGTFSEGIVTSVDSSERNLMMKKVDGKFCFSKSSHCIVDVSPFVFTADSVIPNESETSKENLKEPEPPEPEPEPEIKTKINETESSNAVTEKEKKEYREVGTQNSQHRFLTKLSFGRLKPRSKACTVGKIYKQKHKKAHSQRSLSDRQKTPTDSTSKPIAFAKKISETKKVKLEIRKIDDSNINDQESDQSLGNSVQEYSSVSSNSSSNENSFDAHLKLTATEKTKNDDSNHLSNFRSKSSTIKTSENDEIRRIKLKSVYENWKDKSSGEKSSTSDICAFKQWELIESVLSPVNQQEKETLWDDIRDFVRTKIGRDINDEGAREVCIEIEQDIPKSKKGEPNHMVVAKGNYVQNDGDVEVEVDLTLDDLERILRHRQKKLRKRQKSFTRIESKQSKQSTSSTNPSAEEIHKYESFVNSCKALGGEYITESELRILKGKKN